MVDVSSHSGYSPLNATFRVSKSDGSIVRNWKFTYGLFNIGGESTFTERIITLEGYLRSEHYISEFFICVGFTFAFIIVIYAFLNVNRLINELAN